jgi:hypothetical protein
MATRKGLIGKKTLSDVRATALASGGRTSDERLLSTLRQILDTCFDGGDLQVLCFDLGVNYDNLPSDRRANEARGLIRYLECPGCIRDLVEVGKHLRPDILWEDMIIDLRLDNGALCGKFTLAWKAKCSFANTKFNKTIGQPSPVVYGTSRDRLQTIKRVIQLEGEASHFHWYIDLSRSFRFS